MNKMWMKMLGLTAVAALGYYGFTQYQRKKAIASFGSADKKNATNLNVGGGAMQGIPGVHSGYCGGCK